MLIDTDVLVWYMRGNQRVYHVIEGQPGFSFSVITYMELVQGNRSLPPTFKLTRDSFPRYKLTHSAIM